MRKLLISIVAAISFASCTYVEPNHIGVLQENYGRNGKSDFSLVRGKVSTTGAGTTLYQVPLFEQGGEFADRLDLKAADNAVFYARPTYTYRCIEKRAIDLVFNNKHLSSGGNTDGETFLNAIEDNVLERKIKDLIREESRRYSTDTLMASSGSLKFEKKVEELARTLFEQQGLEITSFTCQLDFPNKVKDKIENRSEVQQNLSVIDQQIIEQRKKNELAKLRAEQRKLDNEGITELYIKNKAVDGWVKAGCPTPKAVGIDAYYDLIHK